MTVHDYQIHCEGRGISEDSLRVLDRAALRRLLRFDAADCAISIERSEAQTDTFIITERLLRAEGEKNYMLRISLTTQLSKLQAVCTCDTPRFRTRDVCKHAILVYACLSEIHAREVKDFLDRVVEGVVEARNDKGIRIADKWYNYSRFSTQDIARPEVGETVRLECNARGFIQALEKIEAPAVAPTSSEQSASPPQTPRRLSAQEYVRLQVLAHALRAAEMLMSEDRTEEKLLELTLRIAERLSEFVLVEEEGEA